MMNGIMRDIPPPNITHVIVSRAPFKRLGRILTGHIPSCDATFLHSLASKPDSCNNESTPSTMRMCV